MIRWLNRLYRKNEVSERFSLQLLSKHNPALAEQFLWNPNTATTLSGPLWFHWGCGDRIFEGFVNVDFRPSDPRVLDWDLLNPWPLDEWHQRFEGAFSEDALEHFFIGEQAYLLCNLNCLLKQDAVSRVLMPSYSRLIANVHEKDARPGGFLHDTFGVTTEVDAINMGMRFSGHRWLHDRTSFSHLAECCGFEAIATSCAESSVPELSHRNLRCEADSASFATDLHKRNALKRMVVVPTNVEGALLIERQEHGEHLYQATSPESKVVFVLPQPVLTTALACVNIRSANVSAFRDHYYKHIAFIDGESKGTWRLDETVKSKASMNLVTRDQITLAAGGLDVVSKLAFSPARKGEYFTQGPLELFFFAQGGSVSS